MKKSIILLAAVVLSAACHKSNSPAPAVPNKCLETSFPHIDTATLWNIVSGARTGGKALIALDGTLTIVGYNGSRGTYAGGKYKMQIADTALLLDDVTFPLYQYGPDSVVSTANWIQMIPTTGWQRAYYRMHIYSGNLPDYSIVAGDFIDSI